jgi:PadR family transcriptional regulator, regulatory protein PadR
VAPPFSEPLPTPIFDEEQYCCGADDDSERHIQPFGHATDSTPASARAGGQSIDAGATIVYIVSMAPVSPLGEFEVVVIMAVLHLGGDAFGSTIRDEIERRSRRRVSRGAVYITLERLEEKGLLTSKIGDATPRRGGRPKRLFRVTPGGVKAVRHSVALLARMHEGLEPILGDL